MPERDDVSTLALGSRLAGRFEIEKLVGIGGMSAVYRAGDHVLGRPVAIKVLHPEVCNDRTFEARFFREARIIASLTANPHVVSIFDLGRTEQGLPYLVMEFLEGQTLQSMLADWNLPSRTWVFDLGMEICAALMDAHAKGVTHRDLKPSNVFLIKSPRLNQVTKVLDFGLARSRSILMPDGLATVSGVLMGTPRYMSPEQAGMHEAGPPSDIYSLGLILYEVASGRYPYAEPPADSNPVLHYLRVHAEEEPAPLRKFLGTFEPSYPESFDDLVHQALAKSSTQRPTAQGMMAKLYEVNDQIEHARAGSSKTSSKGKSNPEAR